MKSLEAIQIELLEQQSTVAVVVVTMAVLWFLRKPTTRFLLWLLKRNLDESQHYLIEVIEKSVYDFIHYALLTLIAYICTSFLIENESLAEVVSDTAFTIFLLTLFKFIYDLARSITASSNRVHKIAHVEVDRTLMQLVRLLINGLIFILAVVAIARTWSISLTTVFAGLGIGGLALSFAAQDTIKSLIGFVTVVYDKRFTVEEYITTPTAEGTVEEIGLWSVKIRCRDQSLVFIPNSTIANEPITNWSRLEKRWLNFAVALPFATTAGEIETFTSEVKAALQRREHVEPESVMTLFTEYDSSALSILIRCYVRLPNYADALAERMAVNLEINRVIDRLGLRLAVPARSLTFDQFQAMPLSDPTMQISPRHDATPKSGQSDVAV